MADVRDLLDYHFACRARDLCGCDDHFGYRLLVAPSARRLILRNTMSANTAIEWIESTWNPLTGCTKVGPGRRHSRYYRLPVARFVEASMRVGKFIRKLAGSQDAVPYLPDKRGLLRQHPAGRILVRVEDAHSKPKLHAYDPDRFQKI